MIFLYVPHLVLAAVMGIHSEIVTVSEVSVKARGSISIPCLYELHYKDHVKCLCKGNKWFSCSYVVKTNKPDNSGKFAISDDKNQRTFTVTINDPTDDGSSYWCAVERNLLHVKKRFELSVATDMPRLYVDQQEMTAFEGGSVTVGCRYEYLDEAKWCRLGGSCVTAQTGFIDGTRVTINATAPNVFTVTMSELRMKSGGWFLCVNGDFQMPVHITVHELSSATTTTTTTTTTTAMSPNTPNFTGIPPNTTQHSSLLTSAESHTAQSAISTINGTGGENLQEEHKSSTMVMILVPTLISLLLVPAAFFGWRMMIRRSKTRPEPFTVELQIVSDPDMHYATIVLNQHTAAQQKQKDIPEESVTYSAIVVKDSMRHTTEPVDESVIYSTISAVGRH